MPENRLHMIAEDSGITIYDENSAADTAAARTKCIEEMAALLSSGGLNVNERDDFGRTPLHRALLGLGADEDIVSLLLEAGAAVDVKDDHGKTPLEAFIDQQAVWGITFGAAPIASAVRDSISNRNERIASMLKQGVSQRSATRLPQRTSGCALCERSEEEGRRKCKFCGEKLNPTDEAARAHEARVKIEREQRLTEERDRKRREEEQRQEHDRVDAIQCERTSNNLCIMCGRPLTLIQRLFNTRRHSKCTTFQE